MAANILDEIIANKRNEISSQMRVMPADTLYDQAKQALPPRCFSRALKTAFSQNRFPVIAEIKRKSPSKGILSESFDVAELARCYSEGGAACLSVLTDERYFGGSEDDLRCASTVCDLPIIRKDFILNEWQILQSRAMGADAILLIVSVLSKDELHALTACAQEWGMDVLVETHNRQEVEQALTLSEVLIGVNNRNLKNFHTDVQVTLDLLPLLESHDGLVISESGIHSKEDISRLFYAGTDAFLIGESLMKNPQEGLQMLFEGSLFKEE